MSGKYQAYPEYKDSGVEWLGPIPANWQVKRVKHLTQLNPSKSEVRGRSEDEHVSFIPMEAIGEQGELDASRSRPLGEVLSGYTYVANGDVMLAKITPCFENGKAAVAAGLQQGIGFATTEVIPVRPNDPEDAKFFYYLLTSMPFKAVAEGSMYGAGGQKRVADSFVAEYHLAAPPSLERTQIAAFLDHETVRIDRLIEKQQRLIELLKEKRQAVISHAVTKGLDPNVPMKDSGVEWLGQVPEHWCAVRVKQVATFITSGPRGWSDFITDTGKDVFLQSGDLNDDLGLKLETAKKVSPPKGTEGVRTRLNNGDVVVCITGANTGRVARVENLQNTTYINQHLSLIRTKPERVNSQYLALFLSANPGRSYFDVAQYGLKEGLSLGNICEAPLALPPLYEQEAIVGHINTLKSKFSILSAKAAKQIELLRERRTALISAAVTGKIDVRNWQPKPSTQATELDLPMAAEQAAEYQV